MAQDKPNVLLIFLDNFGWGEPGFNGGGIIRGNAELINGIDTKENLTSICFQSPKLASSRYLSELTLSLYCDPISPFDGRTSASQSESLS
jgi:hypothetical protein